MFARTLRPLAIRRPTLLLTRWSRQLPLRRLQSTKAEAPKGIKALVKEYGYSALGVYLFLSALDLPVCYAIVHLFGKEEIQKYENQAKQYFGFGKSDSELEKEQQISRVEEAQEPEEPGLFPWFSWTEFAIAYGIHKSVFIFVRVPLTAAITPGIVKVLRRWGFKIGTNSLATTAAIAKDKVKQANFGVPATKKNRWFSWFI